MTTTPTPAEVGSRARRTASAARTMMLAGIVVTIINLAVSLFGSDGMAATVAFLAVVIVLVLHLVAGKLDTIAREMDLLDG